MQPTAEAAENRFRKFYSILFVIHANALSDSLGRSDAARLLSIASFLFLLHLPCARCINRQTSEAISCSCGRQNKMLFFLKRLFIVVYFRFSVLRERRLKYELMPCTQSAIGLFSSNFTSQRQKKKSKQSAHSRIDVTSPQ